MSISKKMRQKIFVFYVTLLTYANGYHPFLSQDEINHVRVERDEGPEACNEDDLMNFLAEIQVINPESIVKLATTAELEPECNKIADNLSKIKKYLKSCTPPSEADLYLQLIKGVETFHKKLCDDLAYRKSYERVHKCVHELRNDLEDCGGPADWIENSDNEAVCNAYKDISDCYYIKIAKVCGKSASTIIKELLLAVIDSILTITCNNVKTNPTVKDPMPESYIAKDNNNSAENNKPSVVLHFCMMTIIKIIFEYPL